MLARVLFAAVALCLIGALPGARAARAPAVAATHGPAPAPRAAPPARAPAVPAHR